MKKFTAQQQSVIDSRGQSLLISASAGTGKTTVMIERIAALIESGQADVDNIVVVTFTNLAAAEMKKRLTDKLAEKRNDARIAEQLERIDSASICTLHSFCGDLLRTYFYVADIDPAYVILDAATTSTLRKNTLDDLFRKYFQEDDDAFHRLYRIFSTRRNEENFKDVIFGLHDFAGCLENFEDWYKETRGNFTEYSENNPVVQTVLHDVKQTALEIAEGFSALGRRCLEQGVAAFAEVCAKNAQTLRLFDDMRLEEALNGIVKIKPFALPNRDNKRAGKFGVDADAEELLRAEFDALRKALAEAAKKYASICRGKPIDELWLETSDAALYCDKLVEIVSRFDREYFEAKKQRGGLDFNDLEHLALKVLGDPETLAAVRSKYKLVFVDEYQDINPAQEAIISRIAQRDNLFMVGDVKQSIYGFRGCEPSIFLGKYRLFNQTGCGKVVELNDNFRSNGQILSFVNDVFSYVMTADLGKVDYKNTAMLSGAIPPALTAPSVRIDIAETQRKKREDASGVYDITAEIAPPQTSARLQAEIVASRVEEYVGMAYKGKDGTAKRVGYGDVVVLMRSMTDRAAEIYDCLVERNIPVAANFKSDGYKSKEVRDIINLLRVVDNPYNDVYLVGACLAWFGGFTENQLAQICIATDDQKMSFLGRLQRYVGEHNDDVAEKIDKFLSFADGLRFFSRSACVDSVVLEILRQTDFHLFVQGLPNGAYRVRKLYDFIDSVKGKRYAQSVDKFLQYLDDSGDLRTEEGLAATNSVRIMSMHASKGLEFPVVIIAGADSPFKNETHPVERNSDLGLAIRNYDFATMKVNPTLGTAACGMFNKLKQKEEEMRLLYVALTRAQCVLNIVGACDVEALPKAPSKAHNHMGWIEAALKRKYGRIYDGFKAEGLEVAVNHTRSAEQTERNLLCSQTADSAAVERRLSYVYPHASATQMPNKVVSSALDKDFLDSGFDEATPVLEEAKNLVGTAYHKVYQFVDYNADRNEIVRTVEALVADGRIERRIADMLDVELIHSTLNNAELRALMKGKVYHELPFMLYAPYSDIAQTDVADKIVLQGVIDLLIIDNNRATVVDFKYTSHPQFVRKNYQAQLNSYRLAVQRIMKIQDVDCYVLSIADNRLIKF